MRRNVKARYFTADDPESGVTPGQLRRLGQARQIEYMRAWFYRMFEDPAEQTPYNSQEGGYLYIMGGPYDADEEIRDEFEGVVRESAIEELVEELSGEGWEWAPGPGHPSRREFEDEALRESLDDQEQPDFESALEALRQGVLPTYGDVAELAGRQELIARINQLEFGLRSVHGGIGHNRPPLDDDNFPVSLEGPPSEVFDAARSIKLELEKPNPIATAVVLAGKTIWQAVRWVGRKIDKAVDAFATTAGGIAATAGAAWLAGDSVYSKLFAIAKLAWEWIKHIGIAQ